VVKISETFHEFLQKLFPKLEFELKLSQMNISIVNFVVKCFILSFIIALNFSVVVFLILRNTGLIWVVVPIFFIVFGIFFFLCINVPKFNIEKVRMNIESDIFIPSRKLLTLLEGGNSIITALIDVSYTKAKSSQYFGNIASQIILGKNIEDAIEDAIKYTPSDSFRRVLEPIKKSLKTGTDIQSSLLSTLEELMKEKIIEIEEYEKKLSPVSMFYMIFGTILPTIGVVALILIMSIMSFEVQFFPFLFLFLVAIFIIQVIFINVFKSMRPLVKL
jgi:pilus assembly protein TadC